MVYKLTFKCVKYTEYSTGVKPRSGLYTVMTWMFDDIVLIYLRLYRILIRPDTGYPA